MFMKNYELWLDNDCILVVMSVHGITPTLQYNVVIVCLFFFVLFTMQDSFWQSAGHPLHVLSVIITVLSSITNNPSLVSSYER